MKTLNFLIFAFSIIFLSFVPKEVEAAKVVCVAIHKDYKNIEKPILISKKWVWHQILDCNETTNKTLSDKYNYNIYNFYSEFYNSANQEFRILDILYSNTTGDASKGKWDPHSLQSFEKMLGTYDYKHFPILTTKEIQEEKQKQAVEIKKINKAKVSNSNIKVFFCETKISNYASLDNCSIEDRRIDYKKWSTKPIYSRNINKLCFNVNNQKLYTAVNCPSLGKNYFELVEDKSQPSGIFRYGTNEQLANISKKIVSEGQEPNTAVTTNQADTININSKTKKLSETEIDEIINLRISNKPKEYSAAVIQEEKLRKEGWKGYDNNQIYIDRINREIFSDMVFNLGSECKTKFFGFFGNKVGSREYYNCIKFAYLKNPEILSKLNPDEKIINLKPKTFWAEFEKNKKLIIYLVIFLLVGSYIFKRIFVKTDIKTNKEKKLNNREIFQNKTITFSLPSFSFVNFINKIILKLKKIKFPGYLFKKHYFGYAITGVLIIIFVPVISNGPLSNLNPLNLISSGSNQYENIDPSTLSIEERRSYNCAKVFGFRKGSDKFKDCVFKIYQTELEIQKLETQKQLAEKELRIAEANARAATERARADQLAQQSAMERQEALLQQQSAAAQRQAAAATAQARQAEIQSSLQMMQQGLQMMQPRSSPRLQTTCTNLGAFINCW